MGSAKMFPSALGGRFPVEDQGRSSVDLGVKLDHAMEGVLIFLLAFVPWPFGSVHMWPEEVVIGAAAILAVLFTVKLLLVRRSRWVGNWTYLPIGLFLLLAAAQLIPLPHSLLNLISPNTLKIRSELLPEFPDTVVQPAALTFYANATHHDLRMVLACSVIFIVSLNTLRTRGRIRRVLIAVAVVGGLVILFALAQDLTDARKMYWSIEKPIPAALGGPFIGHNDFPLFANLSIGAAAALLMFTTAERRSSARHRGPHGFSEPLSPWRLAADIGLLGVILLGTAAVFLSLSRSGLIALAASAACVAILAGIRWHLRLEKWLMGAAVAACFAAAMYFASGSVSHRLATLRNPLGEYFDRFQILKDILAISQKFPIFGTGLGTHELVYPMFEHLRATGIFDHAENEYAQMLEETGVIGLGIILLFIGFIVAGFFRAVRNSTNASIGAASFGLGMGLFAVLIQSAFGFGAHVAANAVLIAIECALLLNIGRILQGKTISSSHGTSSPRISGHRGIAGSSGLPAACAVAMCALFIPALVTADRARRGEAEWQAARGIVDNLQLPVSQCSPDVQQGVGIAAQLAHQADPGNVKYYYWQAMCAWFEVERRHDPNADENVRTPADRAEVERIVAQFDAIRRLAPTYGLALFQSAQLRYLVLNQPAGLDTIRLAASVASTNPQVFTILGSIDCDLGDFAGAMDAYRRYLSLDGVGRMKPSFDKVVQTLVTENKRPDLAMELAGDDPLRQLAIVQALRAFTDRPDFQSLAARLDKSASAARRRELIARCAGSDADASDFAAMAQLLVSEHNLNDAVVYYRRALVKQYDNVQWHLALSRVLLANGQKPEAADEAEICLRLKPDMPEARELIGLISQPGSITPAPQKQQ